MIVTCPNCEARYAVDPLAIGPAGRTVQCARCDNRWFQRVEGPRPAPDLVIRPPTRGAALPAVIEPKTPPPWRRYALIGGAAAAVIIVAVALFIFRHQITGFVSRQASALHPASASAPAAPPASAAKSAPSTAPAPAAATTPASAPAAASTPPAAEAAKPVPGPHLEIDLKASRVELVDGRYIVHGEIVNSGSEPGTSTALKFIFKKNDDVVGEKAYPQKLGPIAPGARLSFSQTLDEPPAGTTDIVPTVE